MDIVLLFSLFALVGVGANVFSKLCSNTVTHDSAARYSLVLIINSIVACFFFLCFSGFRIRINTATLMFSVAYALVVALSVVCNVIVYRYASISNVNVISNACAMICTAALGVLFFSEEFHLTAAARIGIMVLAIIFVFADQRAHQKKDGGAPNQGKRRLFALIALIALISIAGCANTVVLKLYAQSSLVTDENSFFFFTNVVLCLGSAVVFLIACLSKRGELRDALTLLRPKELFSIAGKTVVSNISSLLSIFLIARVDMIVFSPISSAIGILVGVIGSMLFREKLGVFSYIAAAASVIAVIL